MTDWKIEIDTYTTCATRRRGSELISVDVDEDSLDFAYEIGSGHQRESASFSLPMAVLIKLLAAEGYTVASELPGLGEEKP